MIYVFRTTSGQERVVVDILRNKIKKDKLNVYAVVVSEDLKGYVFIEAENEGDVRQAGLKVPHIKSILRKQMEESDIGNLLAPATPEILINKGDIVELTGSAFRGEKAKVIKIDPEKETAVVEPIEVAVPIPITTRLKDIKLFMKKEDREQKKEVHEGRED